MTMPAANRAAPKPRQVRAKKAPGGPQMYRAPRRARQTTKAQSAAAWFPSQQTIDLPATVSKRTINRRPDISGSPYSGDGRIRIRHREYITDVAGSVAFAVTGYSINPGLSTLFPWLSTIAQNYESYLFKNLCFEYNTLKGSSTNGKTLLAVDYDAADAVPVTKQEMMVHRGAVDGPVWDPDLKHVSDIQDLEKFGKQRYIRNGAISSTDIKTYDVGNCLVGTQGCADTTAVGELYVSYDIELMTPQPPQLALETITGAGSISTSSGFGSAATFTGPGFASAATSTLTFNTSGTFYVSMSNTGTAVVTPSITGTATTTAELAAVGTALTGLVTTYYVVAVAGQTVIFNFTSSGAITASLVQICKVK